MKNPIIQKGFTMVELIITIAILSFGIIGVYSAFSPFIMSTNNIPFRFTAVYLAQEGFEIVKNIRDNNFIDKKTWSSELMNCALGCQADYKTGTLTQTSLNQLKPYDPNNFLKLNSDAFYSYDIGLDTKFKRKITINQPSEITITHPSGIDTLKVNIQVFWDYNGQQFSFETKGDLYDWY